MFGKLRKGEVDQTTLMLAGVGALALAGIFVFLYVTGFFSPYQTIRVGGVPIVTVSKQAVIERIDNSYEQRIRDIYNKYKRIIVETGESRINYDTARIDAFGKMAERLKVFVERFTEYAKANLMEAIVEQGDKQKAQETVGKLSTEVSRMVQKMITKTYIVGAFEIVRYRLNGIYYSVLFLDPESIYEQLKAQADVIKALAEEYGAQAEAIFDATRKALDKAYEGTPLENK